LRLSAGFDEPGQFSQTARYWNRFTNQSPDYFFDSRI